MKLYLKFLLANMLFFGSKSFVYSQIPKYLPNIWKINQFYIDQRPIRDTTLMKMRYVFTKGGNFTMYVDKKTKPVPFVMPNDTTIQILDEHSNAVLFTHHILYLDKFNLVLDGKSNKGVKTEYRFVVDYELLSSISRDKKQ